MEKAREIGMPIIPNFIFGHPLDAGKYDNFMAWTEEHRDIIPAVNVNFLSVLFGAAQLRKQRNLPEANHATDLDQNAYRKSWLTKADTVEMLQAVRGVYYTTSGEDFHPDAYAEELTRLSAEEVVANALHRIHAAEPKTTPMLDRAAPAPAYWRSR
jgi:hypothetical protein